MSNIIHVNDLIKEINENRTQTSASSKDEVRVMNAMLNDPEFKVDIFQGDYQGEELAEHNGKAYSIYRTYRVPGTDYMELYLERKGGTNGVQVSGG